jgi:hypothetical protein
VTDPVAYTPTLNSNTGVAANNARWWRAGRYMMIEGAVRYNGTGAASTFTVTLPSGYSIDDTVAFDGNEIYSQNVGFWGWRDAVGSVASRGGWCLIEPNTPTIVRFVRNDSSSYVSSNDFAANDHIVYHLRIPIAGWGSNVQIGSYDGRTVSARYTGTAMSGSFTAADDLKYNNRIYDTHNAYNTSTGLFTAPVAGYYRVSGVCTLSATTTANSSITEVLVYKNGALYCRLAGDYAQLTAANYTFIVPAGSTLVYCNAGETISLRVNTLGTISAIAFTNNANHNYIDIELVPGRSTLAAGDYVPPKVTRYTSGSGTHNVAENTKYLRVRMLGAGGGGGGNSTTSGAFPGGAGGNTTFGTRTAGGGQGGSAALGGAGGTVSGSGYTIVAEVPGADGAQTGRNPSTADGTQMPGGMGGSSFFGGAGQNGPAGGAGGSAVANSGSGGGGGGSDNVANQYGGGGGGAGAYLEFIIENPAPSYSYSVGAGGAASTGASRNGGPGGSGVLIVEEYSR